MNLILTMAGRYKRFFDQGYRIPKYLLPWGDQTILAAIIRELHEFSNILLVANQRDQVYLSHVHLLMRKYNIPHDHLILTEDTSGQAETAMIGVEALLKLNNQANTPVAIHNVDTIVYSRNLNQIAKLLSQNDGYIDIFRSHHKEYSYVMVDDDNYIKEIAEKMVVSNLATSGLYAFRNPILFKEFFKQNEDIYISSIYKKMLQQGLKVLAGDLHADEDTIVLGTPEEFLNASALLMNRPHV